MISLANTGRVAPSAWDPLGRSLISLASAVPEERPFGRRPRAKVVHRRAAAGEAAISSGGCS
jgi:hypothetical protein